MTDLGDVKGVSDTRAENLSEEGYESVEDIASAEVSGLEEVEGVGEATAETLIESAQTLLQEQHGVEAEEEPDAEPEPEPEAEPDDTDDVSIEDLEEINSDQPDGYNEPRDEEEVTAEDDDPDDRRVVDTSPEIYDVEITLTEPEQYDYLVLALVQLKTQEVSASSEQAQMADGLLDEIRGISGTGSFTVSVDRNELNTLHSAVKQVTTNYQGRSIEAFDALTVIHNQVEEARREYLF